MAYTAMPNRPRKHSMRHFAAFILIALSLPAGASDLLAIYDQALQRDPAIKQAEATRNAALENKPQSIAGLLPTLTVSGNYNYSSVLTKGANIAQIAVFGGADISYWNSSATLNLTQPVYHHELWVKLSQADNQVAAAEANYEAAQQELIRRTSFAYFDVLYAQDSLEFARAQKESIGRQLEQAKARFEVGLIAITDVDAAQAGYDQAKANEIAAVNNLDNSRELLREIIGPYEGELSVLKAEMPLKSPEPADMEQWNQRALDNNLDIIAAQNQAELSKKNIDLQFAGHLPTLDLVGSAGFTDNVRPGTRSESHAIGMQVNIPLFQGGMVNSKTRQAREQYLSDQDNLDVRRRAATRLVKNSYRGILSSVSQVDALKSAVVSAKSALEATEAGFEVGTRTMIDVLIQQTNLYQALQNYAKSRYDYIKNSLTLKQAAGMLRREDMEWFNRWLGQG